MNDPIVDEVRRVRDAHAARFNYDLDAIFQDIKEREKKSGLKFIQGVARQPVPNRYMVSEVKVRSFSVEGFFLLFSVAIGSPLTVPLNRAACFQLGVTAARMYRTAIQGHESTGSFLRVRQLPARASGALETHTFPTSALQNYSSHSVEWAR